MTELKKFILLFIFFSLISSSLFTEVAATADSSSPLPATTNTAATPTKAPSPSTETSPASTPSTSASPSPAPSGMSLLFSSVPLQTKNPVLKKICGATDHPSECITSISPFQTGKSDPVSVLIMEMQALRQGFEKAIAKADELTEDPSLSDMFKSCLDTCLEIYDTALYDLDDALAAVTSHDIEKLKTFLSATISDIGTCDEAFLEEPGLDSPMKEFDDELNKLASNNLAIVNALIR